jgi:hypothetical protein
MVAGVVGWTESGQSTGGVPLSEEAERSRAGR